MANKSLWAQATELLKRRGCRWDGRKFSEVDLKQQKFEQRAIRTPSGGKPVKQGIITPVKMK